jgi:uncharacterized membrane protein (DUF2068 family)
VAIEPGVGARLEREIMSAPPRRQPPALDGLRLIGLLKLVKALALVALSYGFYRLLDPAIAAQLYAWSATLTDRPERRLLERALLWVNEIGANRLELIATATVIYVALLTTEGIGLWLRRSWAEWFTVISTSSLIPFELWELITRGPGRRATVLTAFLFNVVIVVYLILRLRLAARARHGRA